MADSKQDSMVTDLQLELLNSFKERGHVYALIYEELVAALGKEQARTIMSKAIYRRGEEKAEKYSKFAQCDDFAGQAKAFVDSSAGGGALFKPGIEQVDQDGCIVSMEKCPLVEAWTDRGLSDEAIKELCDIAYQVDYGKYEKLGQKLEFSHRLSCREKSCRMIIKKV